MYIQELLVSPALSFVLGSDHENDYGFTGHHGGLGRLTIHYRQFVHEMALNAGLFERRETFRSMQKEIKAVKDYQHRLSQAEKIDMGQALGKATLKLKGVEEEKKLANKEFKDRMDALRSDIEELSRAVRDGFVWRKEVCLGIPGSDGLISFMAPTGEVIEIRKMTDAERQQWLFDDDEVAEENEPVKAPWSVDPDDDLEGTTH